MHGLNLIGPARPIAAAAIAAHLGAERFASLPGAYVELVTRWGAGTLCATWELPDPARSGGRFDELQRQLRVVGPARRMSGAWAELAVEDFEGTVLAVDRRGSALLVRKRELAVLHPRGHVLGVASFEVFVAHLVERGALPWGRIDAALDDSDAELCTPATYALAPSSARAALVTALAAGDEAAADAALDRVLGTEVALHALLELAGELAGSAPAARAIPHAVRADYVTQLIQMARRRTDRLAAIPMREIRDALAAGCPVSSPQLAALRDNAFVQPPAGIFLATADATEAELIGAIAGEPGDVDTRLVYADHLEARGQLDDAEGLRAIAEGTERPELVAKSARDPATLLRTYIDAWRAEDPETSIDELLEEIRALSPERRARFAPTLQLLDDPARAHAADEVSALRPMMALALRDRDPRRVRALLAAFAARSCGFGVAPYARSVMERPTPGTPDELRLEIADFLSETGGTRNFADAYLPYLAAGAAPCFAQQLAFRLLVHETHALAGYIRHYCAGHPHSEQALRSCLRFRRREIEDGMLAELARAEARGGGEDDYVMIAKFLSRIGNKRAQDLMAQHRKQARRTRSRTT